MRQSFEPDYWQLRSTLSEQRRQRLSELKLIKDLFHGVKNEELRKAGCDWVDGLNRHILGLHNHIIALDIQHREREQRRRDNDE